MFKKIGIIKYRLKEHIHMWRDIDFKSEFYYWNYDPTSKPTPEIIFRFIMIKRFLQGLQCVLFDHILEDRSYGNPDSGCIDMSCNRCGYNYHQTLY